MKPAVLALLLTAFILSRDSAAAPALTVHEWGTFTSVQGSDGEPLAGLEKEEEPLPSFVHNFDPRIEKDSSLDPFSIGTHCGGCEHCCKGACCDDFVQPEGSPVQVTQKMETPVLYFYSQAPTKVDVTVDFPRGVISQYYPQPTSVLPQAARGQALEGGQIHYSSLEVLSGTAEVPLVSSGNIYGPARATQSNLIRAQGETEKFIFYRGLGNFRTSLKVTSDLQSLVLQDTAGRGIPYMLAVNIRDGKGAFKELGSLAPLQRTVSNLPAFLKNLTPVQDMKDFEQTVKPVLVQALTASGLYATEARAMAETWRVSYFHTDGLRVLYILPRGETDTILPLTLSPAPAGLVRTLVGRIEILTHQEEGDLLSSIAQGMKNGAFPAFTSLGRFREPKLTRLQQLSSDAATRSFIQDHLN